MQSMAAPCGSHRGGAANRQCIQPLGIVSKSQPSSCTISKCNSFGQFNSLAALQNTNSLSSHMMIMCACIVHYVISSCVPVISSFKFCKELFIVNFPNNFQIILLSIIHTVRCKSMYVLVPP